MFCLNDTMRYYLCPGRTEILLRVLTKKETLKWILQLAASIISAVLTALGATSCMEY